MMREPRIGRPLTWAVVSAASIGAGLIHVAFGPEHVAELGPLGYGFYLSGVLQLGWALVVAAAFLGMRSAPTRVSMRKVAIAGIAINLAILAAWAISRTLGLPAGDMPWTPEPVGVPYAICGAIEALVVIGLAFVLRDRGRVLAGSPWSVRGTAAAAALMIALVGIGTIVAMSPSGAGHDHDGMMHAEDGSLVDEQAHEPMMGAIHVLPPSIA